MFKIVRIPHSLENYFDSFKDTFLWDHLFYFRLLVLSMAFAWGRRTISNMYRQLDSKDLPHRTRFNNFVNVARWDTEKALRHKAYELLQKILSSGTTKKKETIYLIIDDSQKMKRGTHMDAAGWLRHHVLNTSVLGHQYVMAVLSVRGHVIPFGIRLYVKKKQCPDIGVTFKKLTQLAAELINELEVPEGIKVRVLFDSFYLCPKVVKACRKKEFRCISTLKRNRNLYKRGRKLKVGTYVRNKFRRSVRHALSITKNHKVVHYSYADAGWMGVSELGLFHGILSRKGKDKNILAIVTDDDTLTGCQIVKAYANRWKIELFFKDTKQLLGLGQYQNLSLKAAVTHLHLVCFAYALLTHIAITREGEKGNKKQSKAVNLSTGTLQNELRRIVWDDLTDYLKEFKDSDAVIGELTRLLAA